jgi:hypothetical protein
MMTGYEITASEREAVLRGDADELRRLGVDKELLDVPGLRGRPNR